MENYIMLNGNKIELTEDKIKLIQDSQIIKNDRIKNCFDRVENGEMYYYIESCDEIDECKDDFPDFDDMLYANANYCTDKKIMQQRAWHEILSRRLWRFSMMNDGDKIDWDNLKTSKCSIYYDIKEKLYDWAVADTYRLRYLEPYFYSEKIAQKAIDEVIIPFMNENPDFIW